MAALFGESDPESDGESEQVFLTARAYGPAQRPRGATPQPFGPVPRPASSASDHAQELLDEDEEYEQYTRQLRTLESFARIATRFRGDVAYLDDYLDEVRSGLKRMRLLNNRCAVRHWVIATTEEDARAWVLDYERQQDVAGFAFNTLMEAMREAFGQDQAAMHETLLRLRYSPDPNGCGEPNAILYTSVNPFAARFSSVANAVLGTARDERTEQHAIRLLIRAILNKELSSALILRSCS